MAPKNMLPIIEGCYNSKQENGEELGLETLYYKGLRKRLTQTSKNFPFGNICF